MTNHERLDGRTRVARHRAAMRAKGYRLKQFWVPDTSRPEFQEMARQEALAIANSPYEAADQAWVDEMTRWFWDDPDGGGTIPETSGRE